MSWWRKANLGDAGSVNGWIKIKSIWRKTNLGDAGSTDGWLRIKSAWRHEGGGIWTRIFSGLSIPTPKSPYPDPLFRWPDGYETFDAPINGSSIAAQRGGWTEEPNKFRIRIQKRLGSSGEWTTIWPTDGSIYLKTYTEYLESDDYDLFPLTLSSRPVISKADTKDGYWFRTAIEAENAAGEKSEYYYGPTGYASHSGIQPRLDFQITDFSILTDSEEPDGVTFTWSLDNFINTTGSINASSDIHSHVIKIYLATDILKTNVIETITLNSSNISQYVNGNTVIYPYVSTLLQEDTEYTAELAVTGMDGYKEKVNISDRTIEYSEVNFTTLAKLPENQVLPNFQLISGEPSCVDAVYRLSSGTWTNNPTQFRYTIARMNAAGTVLYTHPSLTTFSPDIYYDYTLSLEHQSGIEGSVLAKNSSGQAKFAAYSSNTISGPISLPKPTNVSASVSGTTITINWDKHPSAQKFRIYWSTSIFSPGGGADTTFDEEKTVNSWTWNSSDPDKNLIVPQQGSEYRFYVSQSVGGSIWSPWSNVSNVVTVASKPVNITKPQWQLMSGTANKVGSSYKLTSGTWTNNPTQFRYILEYNNASGTEIAWHPSSTGWTTDTSYTHTFNSTTPFSISGAVFAFNGISSDRTYADTSVGPITQEVVPTPILSNKVETTTGFYFTITNYDAVNYTYTLTTTKGSISLSGNVATVSGLISGESATATVTASKTGWISSSATMSGTAVMQYTISWNANGGSVTPSSQTVAAGTVVTAPTPTRTGGYTFLYWRDYFNAQGYVYQINPGGTWTVNSDITFYAWWQDPPTLPTPILSSAISTSGGFYFSISNWDSNNSYTVSTTAGSVTRVQDYIEVTGLSAGQSATVSVSASRSNYLSSGTATRSGSAISQFTISWNANGGSVTPSSQTVASGTVVTAPTPTKNNSTFLYWRDAFSAQNYLYQINPGGTWTVTSNITFYAWWQDFTQLATPILSSATSNSNGFSFNIDNFDANNSYSISTTSGSISRSSSTVTVSGLSSGNSATATVIATRTGFLNSNAATRTGSATSSFTVTWDANGGTVSPSSSSGTSGTSVTAPTPSRSGYTFLYWRDTPSGDYTYQVNAGSNWTITGNVTFYARWSLSGTAPSNPSVQGFNNLFPNGGTFQWSSTGTAPITYVFTVYSPPDAYGNRTVVYTTGGQAVSDTSVAIGSGRFTVAGSYRIIIYAVNSFGSSGTVTFDSTFT